MKKSARLDWIDAAKGIGLILVLIGHAPRDVMRSDYAVIDYLYQLIYQFHMPLFFFLAGCVYTHTKKKWMEASWSRFVVAKAKALLVPWLCFSLLVYAAVWSMHALTPVVPALAKIPFEKMSLWDYMAANLDALNPYCFHVWYMYVLFIIQAMVYLAERLIGKVTGNAQGGVRQTMSLLALALIAYFVIPLDRQVTYCIFTFLLYYILGMLYIERAGGKAPAFSPLYLFGAGLCVWIIWGLYRGGLSNETIKGAALLLQVFVGAPLMVMLTAWLAGRFARSKGLCWTGARSFDIYLLHQPLCAAAGSVLMMVFSKSLVSYTVIMTICLALSVLFPIAATEIGYRLGLARLMKACLGVSRILGGKSK